ncbi:MAG: trehalose-6-phosphate synthase [Pseudomonadota bacterium]
MGRLVILSNRIPTGAIPSGGLVVALHDCLTARGGVWVGSAEDTVADPSNMLMHVGEGDYQRFAFDMTEAEHEGFYLGYSNSVLWPLFHWRADLIDLNTDHAEAYLGVNARVAKLLSAELAPDDLLWVHDYHFLPIAAQLRMLGVTNRIGFFLHTPFPHAQDLFALPQREEFTEWLAAFDLIGLQAERDVAALLELFRSEAQGQLLLDGTIQHRDGRFSVMSCPIGIDVEDFIAQADASDGADKLGLRPADRLVIGVDRLDYSKGLVNRFEAFGEYLAAHSEDRPPATFLQIAQPSRSTLDAYQDIRSELEKTAGYLNGTYGKLDWTPIRYLCRSVPRERIAGLFRRANVGLVTPLADGMNLVAKEYIAAQDPKDPGVLILSHFAGAAEQMTAALLVNPYDTEDVAGAIDVALAMPREERIARHQELMADLRRRDITWWTDTFLQRLAATPATSDAPP